MEPAALSIHAPGRDSARCTGPQRGMEEGIRIPRNGVAGHPGRMSPAGSQPTSAGRRSGCELPQEEGFGIHGDGRRPPPDRLSDRHTDRGHWPVAAAAGSFPVALDRVLTPGRPRSRPAAATRSLRENDESYPSTLPFSSPAVPFPPLPADHTHSAGTREGEFRRTDPGAPSI